MRKLGGPKGNVEEFWFNFSSCPAQGGAGWSAGPQPQAGSSGLTLCSWSCTTRISVEKCPENIQACGQGQMCVCCTSSGEKRSEMSPMPEQHKGLFVSLYPTIRGFGHLPFVGVVYLVPQTLQHRNQAVINQLILLWPLFPTGNHRSY